MSAHKHYTVAAVPAGEAKDIGAMIVTALVSAGVLVPAAWLGSMMARDLVSALDNAINAVRDSITYLRFGAEMEDLQRVVDELQTAGVQIPADILAIVNNPSDGDSYANVNIAKARGWLETTLRVLQDAQERAESMDEQRSDQQPREEKGDVIYGAFGSGSEDSGEESGEPGDVSEFYWQSVMEVDGASTTIEDMYYAYTVWCEGHGYTPVPNEAFKRELMGMGIVSQLIGGRARWVGVSLKSAPIKSAGAHTLYR